MAGWVTDDEFAAGLGIMDRPAPEDTHFRAFSGTSKQSPRRNATPRSSPVRMAEGLGDETPSIDPSRDESISILDPRRFTPTLHANLVSEILALRRDQEEKTRQLDSLESTLHTAKEDQERLQGSLADTAKENRSLKRQLALLEGGTSSALSELARERDEAVDSTTEIRKRLEAAQKKLRTQEDDSQRVHDLWEQEKTSWEDERRMFKRKLHVTESRLKTVLDEIAAYQAAHQDPTNHLDESDAEHSDQDSQAESHRTMSITNSIHRSLYSSGPEVHHGQCLADELDFDDDHTDADGRESVLSLHTSPKRNRKQSRNQSLDSLPRNGSLSRRRSFGHRIVAQVPEGEEERDEARTAVPICVDAGIQYSPPPSPELRTAKPVTPDIGTRKRMPDVENSRGDSEIEANQRRKRVQVNRPLKMVPHKADYSMVSASAQTVEEPLSPPKTPQTSRKDLASSAEHRRSSMVSCSTQTEVKATESMPSSSPSPPVPLSIPSISVQPPRSRPSTPRSPRLPQYTKNVGCQASLPSAPTKDASAQTQGIQIDKRLARLPRHLQPSAITSRSSSPNVAGRAGREKNFTPVPGDPPARNPRRLTQGGDAPDPPPTPTASHGDGDVLYDSYQAPDDQCPPSSSRGGSTRRSRRLSSLFAGFDTASSDGMDEFGDLYMSDVEYRTALCAPNPPSKTGRPTKRGSPTAPTHPLQEEIVELRSGLQPATPELYSTFSLVDKENRVKNPIWRPGRGYDKPCAPTGAVPPSGRNGAMRKTALIQSGIASHQIRSRSPSWPNSGYPPFPIPKRASSRKPAADSDARSDGQSSPTRADGRTRAGGGRQSVHARNIRKVRSAMVLSRGQRQRRQGSRSPPPLSPSAEPPEALGLPPLPDNDITARGRRDIGSGQRRGHHHEPSTATDHTHNTELPSRTSGSQTTGVVDAIAHAMVGEWMLKYVRRRRSFGIPENTGKDDSSNDRHKRWVWLAPYERAILWSSKQPSSGSALMGKSGRKLTIQSVLDVKDDNPAPRVMPSVFNRSILILTPQRALKFTATSAERHYLWLTALSFLAHSSHAVPEMLSPPHLKVKQQQQQQAELDIPRVRFRRSGIRDSIRLAKGKSGGPKMADSQSRTDGVASPPMSGGHSREESVDAAEPPLIPRFGNQPGAPHGRKRSNTGGPVAPPRSFRGYSGPLTLRHQSTNSIGTANSSDLYQSQASTHTTWNMSQAASPNLSEASSRRPSHFVDSIGTVRMEAFISPLSWSQFDECPDELDELATPARGRSKEARSKEARSKKRSRGRNGTRAEEEEMCREDPFKGF
ncbi:hypothetical protein XA68_17356 [Ophiocordyceps unilateralis]|uniref:Pleckstrin homology domain-containing protein n=1 Tax=Ophiocordyceps unilateralis TaxID=268505 RepID=A0A2A9PKL9_OPHUN|nr:hypothetical protein XA68_17356 [Ophiocordyceps unilateralis]